MEENGYKLQDTGTILDRVMAWAKGLLNKVTASANGVEFSTNVTAPNIYSKTDVDSELRKKTTANDVKDIFCQSTPVFYPYDGGLWLNMKLYSGGESDGEQIPTATQEHDGLMSRTDKVKLNSLQGASVSDVITDITKILD